MSRNAKQEFKKILVLGLDNSGKTSIVFNFIGEINLPNFISLKETKKVNIVNLEKDNFNFKILDFGGKEIYRNEFLKKFNEYIIDTEEIFYVIDIQDHERYESTLNFLKEIIKRLKTMKYKIEFTFFLHKFDNNLFELNPNINDGIINDLIEKIRKIVPSEEFHEIYKSTIYTVLDKIHVY